METGSAAEHSKSDNSKRGSSRGGGRLITLAVEGDVVYLEPVRIPDSVSVSVSNFLMGVLPRYF